MGFKNLFLVSWGTLEILLFAGQIFGWASLVYVFKQRGFFSEYCDVNFNVNSTLTDHINASYSIETSNQTVLTLTHGCTSQDAQFNLVYTIAVVFNGISSFFNGWLLDRYGTRLCRIIAICCYTSSILMAAFATKETAYMLYLAMAALAYGGYFVLLTNFQLANLIPSRRSTIISLYCGAYDTSSFMFILVMVMYDHGLGAKYSFFIILSLFSIVVLSTFWFLPKKRIPFPIPEGYNIQLLKCCEGRKILKENGTETEELRVNTANETESVLPIREIPSFRSNAMTWLFAWDVIWLTFQRFQSWSFVGKLNLTLNQLAENNKEIVGHYTSVYAGCQFVGVILAPLSGLLMDRRKKKEGGSELLRRIEKVEVSIPSFVIDSSLGLLLAIMLCIPVLQVQYVCFILHVCHRALLYGPNSAFIAQAFTSQHFGKLFGFAMSTSAAFALLQYPFVLLIIGPLQGNPLLMNIFILILMVLAFGHPIYLKRWCQNQKKINRPILLSD